MKLREFFKKYLPLWVLISLGALAVSLILYTVALYVTPLADFLTNRVAVLIRLLMSALTYILPFSLFELVIILLLPLFVLLVILVVRDKGGAASRVRTLFSLLGVIGILYSGYILVMATAYRTTPLADHLGIEDSADIEKEDLYATTRFVVENINALADEVDRKDGLSYMPYTLDELSHKICASYDAVREEYPFFLNFESRAKPVLFSGVMSDMGITGIYTYFTGEANVNTEYPDFTLAFVTAHELAHQRGIMRENEANLMAYLVTTSSPDAFIRYSGYLYMYQYLANALYSTDKELYSEVRAVISEDAIADIAAANAITKAHSDSLLNKIFDSLNDVYLKSNGTPGTVSYGYVVRLAVAYHKANSDIGAN